MLRPPFECSSMRFSASLSRPTSTKWKGTFRLVKSSRAPRV
jgi:hypothetical protein